MSADGPLQDASTAGPPLVELASSHPVPFTANP
jgi:hypothetical protein